MTDRFDIEPGRAPARQMQGDNRNLGELVSDITGDMSTLIRQELELAKAEATQSATRAGKGAGFFGGAGVAGHFVLLFLSVALWWAIGHLLDSSDPRLGWSAVIVAGIWAVVAAVLAAMGKSEMNRIRGLQETTDSVGKIPNAMKGQEARN